MNQRMRQQCAQKQVIDTSRSVGSSLLDEHLHPAKFSEKLVYGQAAVYRKKKPVSSVWRNGR